MKRTKEMCLCALFTALMCASAYIKIPTPLLPITLQTLFVSLAGLILGSRKGFLSVAVYVFIGLTGIPVFAEGGGLSYVLKPSFGYIVGFILSVFITGKLAEKKCNYKNFLLSSLAGMIAVYAVGIVYYYLISTLYLGNQIEIKNLFIYCFLLTLPGDILMCVLASTVGKRLKNAIKF
ncbi:MAG: biotin transporter BioY [Clostridia bacterium]|nr:biotin transporter BioY [Clostridia bacterium]